MKVNLEKWYRCKIDKHTLKELTRKSDWQGIKHILIWVVALVISGYFAYLTWGTWWTVFWFLIYGNIFIASNPVWHETGHKTAFKSDWLNSTFYHIGSFMFNLEPIRWRWSHFNHHSHSLWTAIPYDYEIQITKPTDLIYFFLLLIPGGSFFSFYKLFYSFHVETIKHALGFTTKVMHDCIPEKQRPKCRFWARIHVILWISIILYSILITSWLPIIYILCPYFYGNTLRNVFDIMQHAGLANNVKDHRLSTRTVILNPIFSFLYWHMEYHMEHHMFPTVPSYNLPKLHKLIKDQVPPPKNGIWDAYKEIIPAVIKQARDPNYKINVLLPNTKNI